MNKSSKTDSLLAAAFSEAILGELSDSAEKIEHCVAQLSDDQLWWRPDEGMNSIANLILHLCGNVRQWVIAGVRGEPDRRNRPQEFAQRERISRIELLAMLGELKTEVRETLGGMHSEDFMQRRNIQSYDVSCLEAIVASVAHFRGHTQEIIHMTRVQLGSAYKFDFIPSPEQQGGAAVADVDGPQ